ncbi:uncharacterized protein LOC121751797 isoform X2 [Salvia splendens]|uniref:uncharacterized protein LOC121751797 isoform X2 n=1 Tax=Salvia splendens TaxID=180675 RepID=UPI001C26227F|nr:uncharacterized protein LOC121751797 isoform X2 [Salvia splendens]
MASLQVDHASDVITEAEVTSKEPPPLAAPENAKALDVEDEEDLEDLSEPTYEEKTGNSDDEDAEYSPFMEREDGEEAPPLSYGGGPATFDDFNEDDDEDDIV